MVCQTKSGGTVQKSATPTAEDYAQFAKGFVAGVLEGLWQQVSGLWGLVMNAGSLWQLGKDLVHHTAATLKAIAHALGKQFQTVTQFHQELVCEPYDGPKTTGVPLVTLAATLDGEGVVNDLNTVARDLEDAAKNAGTETLDVQIVNASNDDKAVSEQFASGQTAVVEVSKDAGKVGFADLAKIR